MSSHHIVRENQEPALFIAHPNCLDDEYLNQLLEWSPTIITLAEHYEVLKSREIKIDVILDNQGLEEGILEENILLIPYSDNFIEPLFSYLKEKKNFAVNILTADIQFDSYSSYLADFNINLLNNNGKTMFLKNYEKWLPKEFNLKFEQLKETLSEQHNLTLNNDNCYVVLQDGFVTIPNQEDFFIITEEL